MDNDSSNEVFRELSVVLFAIYFVLRTHAVMFTNSLFIGTE